MNSEIKGDIIFENLQTRACLRILAGIQSIILCVHAKSHEVSQNMFSLIKYSPLSDFLHIDQLIHQTTPSTGYFVFSFFHICK